jgi:hypothetical protein
MPNGPSLTVRVPLPLPPHTPPQAFQGWMTPSLLAKVGLDPGRMAQPHHMLDTSRPGFAPGTHDCSLLRGAVVFSDRTTTVSPTYAREVFSPEFGMGAQVGGGRVGARRGRCPAAGHPRPCGPGASPTSRCLPIHV